MEVPKSRLEKQVEALKAENAELRSRNEDLYRDCVSFAKLIKASSKKDEKIEELQEEIINLKAQIEALRKNDLVATEAPGNLHPFSPKEYDKVFYDPKKQVKNDDEETEVDEEEYDENSVPKNHTDTSDKRKLLIIFKTFIIVLFIVSILATTISAISALFATKYKDYSVGGYRFCTVYNGALSPEVSMDDVLLVKYTGFDGIELDSLVVTTKNTRSVAKITGLSNAGDKSVATVKDKNGSYDVSENQFIGKVSMVIPFVGTIVAYACAHTANYFAIVFAINIFLLALILIVPSGKPKKPKFGKDYTVEDFTI